VTISKDFADFFIWLFASIIAYIFALQWIDSAIWQGHYLPTGADSFYHATRILDVAVRNIDFYEFDTKIHAPEGSWITWPWLYDWLLANATKIYLKVGGKNPLSFLVYIPPTWIVINILLSLLIANEFRFHLSAKIFFVFSVAISPIIQEIHAVGRIDHHYVELTCILAAFLFGSKFIRRPNSASSAIILGLVFAISLGIHNGLFILQIPILLTVFIKWLRKETLNESQIVLLTASLLLSLLFILFFSDPFRDAQYSFYTLSYFHLYVSSCTALSMLFFIRFSLNKRSLALYIATGVFLVSFIMGQVAGGLDYIGSTLIGYENIAETKTILERTQSLGIVALVKQIGLVSILSLIFFVWLLIKSYKLISYDLIYCCIFLTMGFGLMLFQLRFQYYGVLYLVFPLSLWLEYSTHNKGIKTQYTLALVILFIITSIAFSWDKMHSRQYTGLSVAFDYTKLAYAPMADQCEKDPGIILSSKLVGHFIRYFTDCSVVVNTFIMTKQHQEKISLMRYLFAQPVETLKTTAPWIKYIFLTNGTGEQQYIKSDTESLFSLLMSKRPYKSNNISILLQMYADDASHENKLFARFYKVNWTER